MNHALNSYRDVDGYLTEEDVLTLQSFSKKANTIEGNAIEIGSYKGLSAVILLGALDQRKKLISVDINNYPEFSKAINDYGFTERSSLTITNFRKYNFSKEKYSLVFIDHNHEYKDNMDCFDMVLPFVEKNGYILFHDVGHPNYPGVEQAVDKITQEYNSVKLIIKKFTTVFQVL